MAMVSPSDNDNAAREPNDVLQWFDADRGEFVSLEQLIAQHPAAFFASNRFKLGSAHSDAETTVSMVDLPETAALLEAHAAHLLDDVFSRVMPVASSTFVGHMTSSLPVVFTVAREGAERAEPKCREARNLCCDDGA
jgi:glutamate decarboxylase